jgi:hypothetical protein
VRINLQHPFTLSWAAGSGRALGGVHASDCPAPAIQLPWPLTPEKSRRSAARNRPCSTRWRSPQGSSLTSQRRPPRHGHPTEHGITFTAPQQEHSERSHEACSARSPSLRAVQHPRAVQSGGKGLVRPMPDVTSAGRQVLPAGPRLPRAVQALRLLQATDAFTAACRRRYADTYTLGVPQSVTVWSSDPELTRLVTRLPTEISGTTERNATAEFVFGPRSPFVVEGEHSWTRWGGWDARASMRRRTCTGHLTPDATGGRSKVKNVSLARHRADWC